MLAARARNTFLYALVICSKAGCSCPVQLDGRVWGAGNGTALGYCMAINVHATVHSTCSLGGQVPTKKPVPFFLETQA